MYKIVLDEKGNNCAIRRLSDDVLIPLATANTDYQAYLKWVAEGNTPEPADEVA
jgi:hypothetical protein